MASVPCLRSRTSAASAALRVSRAVFFAFSLETSSSTCHARNQPPLPSHRGYWISRMRDARTTARALIGEASSPPWEGRAARIAHGVAQVFLDPQQLVVLRHAIGAGQRAGLDLQRVRPDGQVGDGGVLRLSRAMRDDGAVA